MTVANQEYPSEVVCGTAKKIAMELDKLPIETHQVVVGMLAQLFQHRGLSEQNRQEREKLAREEAREKRESEQNEAIQAHIARSKVQVIGGPTEEQNAGKTIEVPANAGVGV